MSGYLVDGLPGGVELEQKLKRYKKTDKLYRRVSDIQ